MFRYRIAALACAPLASTLLTGRSAWEDTNHVSDSCRMRNHSLLQMNGGMSHKLPPSVDTLRHHVHEDGTTMPDLDSIDTSNVTLQGRMNDYHRYVPNDDNASSGDKASRQQEFSQSRGAHHLEDDDADFDQAPTQDIISQDLPHSVGILRHDVNILADHTPTDAISLRFHMPDKSQKHQHARMPPTKSESLGALHHKDGNSEYEQVPTVASTGTPDGSVMSRVLPESVDIPEIPNVNIVLGDTPTDSISLRFHTARNSNDHPQSVDISHQDHLKNDGDLSGNDQVRTQQELSQSADALRHYDNAAEFDQVPTNARTKDESVMSQELPQSALILRNPDVKIMMDHIPPDAIKVRLQDSQEHPESADVFQQGYQYNEDDNAFLNPTDASTMTVDEAEMSPEFSQKVGILGQEGENIGLNEAPTDASIVTRSTKHAGSKPEFSQSIGILGQEDSNDSWDSNRTDTLEDDDGLSYFHDSNDTFVVPDDFPFQETAQFFFRDYAQHDRAMLSQLPVDASTVTLDETGYQEVASLCCAEDMRIFVKRVVPAEGYKVCNESGLSGLLWWYDCPDDRNTYANLVKSIKDASSGECKWVAPAGQNCPQMPDTCLIPDPEPLPACYQSTITTTTGGTTTTLTISDITCCAPAPQASLSQVASDPAPFIAELARAAIDGDEEAVEGMERSVDRLSHQRKELMAAKLHQRKEKKIPVQSGKVRLKTAPLDCGVYLLPIQVWAPSAGSPEYSVSQLSISTGDYNLIYTIPRTTTTPAFSNLNSAGISPVDSKAYGTVTVAGSNDFYIVRHDKDGLEFVGRIPPPSTWSSKTTGYNSAAFSLSGDYYLMSKGKRQDLFVIKDLPSKLGFPNQLPAQGLADLETEMVNTKFSLGNTDRIADMAAVPMDLDGSGDVVDYAFGLDAKRILYIVKIGSPKVMWKLKASGNGLVPSSSQGFGAAWSYGQKVFFASNSGGGVYEVDMTSVDLQGLTVTMKYVGKSTATTANDGMNCLDADSPWPEQGDCDQGEVQVDAVGGVCPAGSISK